MSTHNWREYVTEEQYQTIQGEIKAAIRQTIEECMEVVEECMVSVQKVSRNNPKNFSLKGAVAISQDIQVMLQEKLRST